MKSVLNYTMSLVKSAKETFKFWGGEDSVLARIVYFIRELRPDVVITNHDTITTKPNRQHGNHQAVGITIYEAFDKAADPNYHPEQLVNGITPWQIKKLYFRVYDTTKNKGIVTIDIQKKDNGETIEDL
jgi:LmbE family N-acetylglucosaminyl deacetylase